MEVKYGRNVTVGKSRDDLQAEIKEVRICELGSDELRKHDAVSNANQYNSFFARRS